MPAALVCKLTSNFETLQQLQGDRKSCWSIKVESDVTEPWQHLFWQLNLYRTVFWQLLSHSAELICFHQSGDQ